jgi:two-component system response regulator AtoC
LSRHVRFTTQPGTHTGLSAAFIRQPSQAPASEAPQPILTLDLELRAAERRALERALTFSKHNRSLAARLLGVSRSTLYAKLKEHGLL